MQFCSWTHLGSTAAIAFAPSMPIMFSLMLRSVRGALKNPTESGKIDS